MGVLATAENAVRRASIVVMFDRRSKSMFVAALLGVGYFFLALYFAQGLLNVDRYDTLQEAELAGLIYLLVTPHLFITFMAVLLSFIAFFRRSPGLGLTSAILYTIAAFLFILGLGFLLLPSVVFGFVGYTAQKRLNS